MSLELDEKKLKRKLRKCLNQLAKYDPEVCTSAVPTKHLFVANSSVLCGVVLDDLIRIFEAYDVNCSLIVYPTERSYSFVSLSSIQLAECVHRSLNGKVPELLSLSNHAIPFYTAYVCNLPEIRGRHSEAHSLPPGLLLHNNFICEEEEAELFESVQDFRSIKKTLKSRQVMHFGYVFNYDTNDASTPAEFPLPSCCSSIIDRMLNLCIFIERPNQLTVNIYEPGGGIPSHIDSHSPFGDTIVSLSLFSDVVMEFRDLANTSAITSVLVPRLSLLAMKGESRYRWKHGIAKRKYDINPDNNRLIQRTLRLSFTFRNTSKQKCQCPFVEYCDWDRNGTMRVPDSEEQGLAIEKVYVASVYNTIAAHFDKTRHAQWLAVDNFLNDIPCHSLLIDVGCGNGKYLARNDKLIKIGCDLCLPLCEIVNSRNLNVLCADALTIPFLDACADAVISIAVIHHFSTFERRLRAMQEILRIMKKGASACITVWSMEQKMNDTKSEYLKMRGKKRNVQMNRRVSNDRLRVHEGRDFTQQDMLVPWQNADGTRHLRYYHLFFADELEGIIEQIEGVTVKNSFYQEGNWIVFVMKS